MHAIQACIIGLTCLLWLPWTATAQIHHNLDVTLQPDSTGIEVRDTITLPDSYTSSLIFALHPALQPQLENSDATLTVVSPPADVRSPAQNPSTGVEPRQYRVDLAAGEKSFTLRYTGRIAHALRSHGEEYARDFQETQGIISPLGVFLSGSSAWYPEFNGTLMTFDLRVVLPEGWKSMSQGEPVATQTDGSVNSEHWKATTPQEEIYLIAGPFSSYSSHERDVTAMVLLREADPALASKYLDTTHQYIALYNELIGPYPFKKFAMVENFWETGYGMPSFTLLGSRVLRFPFILHSSYPHEILHNWWGNGVYVDYDSGNWAEGLTSYLADHLIKEQRDSGVEYRRNTLQKYTDYVRHQDDFPLTDFRSRHSARTEAVGYGKTLMLFHMLRRQIGDTAFKQGLQAFYRQQLFRPASFSDLQTSFSALAGEPLNDFFRQWVQRTGSPQLRVGKARVEPAGTHYRLIAEIEQIQPDRAYTLKLPVAVHMDGPETAYQTDIDIRHRQQSISLKLPARPTLLQVDPEFDVFRRLHRNEIPPAVSQAMGARQVTIVLSDNEAADLKQAYQALAEKWQTDKPDQVEVVYDIELQTPPADRTVWLFGWHNRFRPRLKVALQDYGFEASDDNVHIANTTLTAHTHSLAILGRQPENHEHALGWLAADSPAAVASLGRKLPHYGRYSYLAFTGTEADNVLKGQWPVVNSPLTVQLEQPNGAPKSATRASLAPRKALALPAERYSVERMQRDIAFLADPRLAGRAPGTAGLETAADYIAQQFKAAQLQPADNHNSYFQTWQHEVGKPETAITLKNVVAILPGSNPDYADQSVVIGAHYDHLGLGEYGGRQQNRGKIHPGADDNASGIAVLLELARSLQGKPLPRTLVFVAFTGEENGLLGSRHYIRHSTAYPADGVIAMLNLDTVGRLNNRPLILFGTGSADEWVHIFRGVGYVTGISLQSVADDFGSSDQTAFIEAGIPAVQLFSGNHEDVHSPGDTADKLDYEGLTRVARVLDETVRYLAERPEPLQSTLAATQHSAPVIRSSPRRVSFGSVPDFTWNDSGVRLEDVRADTPAERAGLRKGDIIIEVNNTPIADIRNYSDALKKLDPGDTIQLRFLRDGVEKTLSTRVTER